MAQPAPEPLTEAPPADAPPAADAAAGEEGPPRAALPSLTPVSIGVTGVVLGMYLSLILVVRTLAIWPILLGALGLGGWAVFMAWRPRLTLLRIWLLLAAIGALAGSARYYVRDADRRARALHDRWASLSLKHHRELEPHVRRLRQRARLGDPVAVERLRERVVRQDPGWLDDGRMAWLQYRMRERSPELTVLMSRIGGGSPVPAPPESRGVASAIGAILEARGREEQLADAIDAIDGYEDQLARHHAAGIARFERFTGASGDEAEARFVWRGQHPPRSAVWEVTADAGARWPEDYPYLTAAYLPPEADLLASDWLVRLERADAPALDRALIFLERDRPAPAIPLLQRARAEARAASDRAAEAEAALWLLLAERRTPSPGEITRIDPQGWPAAVAEGLDLLFGEVTDREREERLPLVRDRVRQALLAMPVDPPQQAAHPRRVVLYETYVRLDVAWRPEGPPDRDLGLHQLQEVRPALARRIRTRRFIEETSYLVWNERP